jgi:hypothetical protein
MNPNRAVVLDRWNTKDGKRTARYGGGMRWWARFIDDAGREQTKAFARKADARAWLDDVITRLGTGTYTDPEAGRVTVATVYAAWSAAPGAHHAQDGGQSAQRVRRRRGRATRRPVKKARNRARGDCPEVPYQHPAGRGVDFGLGGARDSRNLA